MEQGVHHPACTTQKAHSSQTNQASTCQANKTTFIQILVSIKKPSKITPSRKVRKGKPSLVDEEDEAQQEPEPQGEGDDPALELAKKLSLDAHQEKGEGEESGTEATAPKVDKEQGEVASTTVTSGVGISVRTENQAKGYCNRRASRTLTNRSVEEEKYYRSKVPKVHENLKLKTDEHVILENPESSSVTLSSMKNLDETDNFGDQFLNDKPTEDDQEKTNVVDETDSIIPDPSHQTNTSAPPVTTPVINISSPKPSSQVNAPPINTEATIIITTILEITPFIALQLRVVKLEQDLFIDKYLGTKVDDALLKALEKHTAYLIQKYSGLPAPESSKKQESKKCPKEILRIKREQEEQKHVPTYTIKSTDTATLKEFDLKAALFKTIHENKFANRNPANKRLYHALMEALIEDENAMEKEVAEDDDDEGPPAGSNQGKSTKRRRHDSGASRSAQPPSKDSEQSTKNKLYSDASAAQQPPAHTSSA
ncbi:hypothetical protein Tco_1295588 [Tanacetum coccineum]